MRHLVGQACLGEFILREAGRFARALIQYRSYSGYIPRPGIKVSTWASISKVSFHAFHHQPSPSPASPGTLNETVNRHLQRSNNLPHCSPRFQSNCPQRAMARRECPVLAIWPFLRPATIAYQPRQKLCEWRTWQAGVSAVQQRDSEEATAIIAFSEVCNQITCVLRLSGRFPHVCGELDHLPPLCWGNPLYFLLKSSRDIKFNHLCHNQPPIHKSAPSGIECHRDEMAASVT